MCSSRICKQNWYNSSKGKLIRQCKATLQYCTPDGCRDLRVVELKVFAKIYRIMRWWFAAAAEAPSLALIAQLNCFWSWGWATKASRTSSPAPLRVSSTSRDSASRRSSSYLGTSTARTLGCIRIVSSSRQRSASDRRVNVALGGSHPFEGLGGGPHLLATRVGAKSRGLGRIRW